MGLTDKQICEILLELCKTKVPHQYSSLARHTEDAGKLWIELASSLNNDVEDAKCRKALCGISRKVAEPINLPLFDIRSLYHQILDLTHPGLDERVHEKKATQLACKCIEFLVTKGTSWAELGLTQAETVSLELKLNLSLLFDFSSTHIVRL